MPIGIDDFKEIIDGGYYFVDKTDFIRQIIEQHSKVTLITRPRRFGKTLMMSMLSYFFSNAALGKNNYLFKGLAIEKAGQTYMSHCGQYPVLFLSLKEIQNPSWQSWPRMLQFISLFMSRLYAKYQYLRQDPAMNISQIQIFDHIVSQQASEDELAVSLSNLMDMLRLYYQKRVILLIDEYDVPIQQAWESQYYTGCIGFMRQFLSGAMKTNDSLEFAVLTGVLRISKESIFSGLNNLDVCTVLKERYRQAMGFTAQEVEKMAVDLHQENNLPEIKHWYDGYRFGGQEIYNPWSVINFFYNGKLDDYWVNTSGNTILYALLEQTTVQQSQTLQNLLEDKTIFATLAEQVVYGDIKKDSNALYTLLLATGYLTVDSVISELRKRYALRIPNREIKDIYSREILNHLTAGLRENSFDDLFDYLLLGNAEAFEHQLQTILRQVVSTYDAANKESFYHGFMLGMTALFLNSTYSVESNRESGYGRFDLALFPKDTTKAGVIMEFKAADSPKELPLKAKEALEQIRERQYVTEFEKRNISKVWLYGIAFSGKQVLVKK